MVIGGYAAQLRGSELPTVDVDVLPERSTENLTRLARALVSLHAKLRVDGVDGGLPFGSDAASLSGLRFLNLTTPWGDVDLTFEPAGVDGYDHWAGNAAPMDLGNGLNVLVADLTDIIRSKEAAGRVKDIRALPALWALRERGQNRPPVGEGGTRPRV